MAHESIQNLIIKMCDLFGSRIDGIEVSEQNGHTTYMIKTNEPQAFIGSSGEHLEAFNYLMRKIANSSLSRKNNNSDDYISFEIDVNNFRQERVERIQQHALEIAQRVTDLKEEEGLDPASSFERMVVHNALEDHPSVRTESRGEGKLRRVVIVLK